jgi:diguanylate cyclase
MRDAWPDNTTTGQTNMPIPYHHDRERSAEILRLAIGLMGRQKAGFHPTSYTIWYEHVAGVNPRLSEALERSLEAGDPLTDDEVMLLYARHVATRDADTLDRIKQRLLTLLQETSDIVCSTGSHTMLYGEVLEGQTRRLSEPASLESIRDVVDELLHETQHMQTLNVTLSEQLQTSAAEVRSLTDRLQKVQAEALRDPLTGLLNRRGFENAVAELSAAAGGLQGAALLLADVDHFKQVNDSHGHLLGDQVLCVMAEVLRARTRGSDIATRLGGDEFAVLLPATPLQGAVMLAEQIRAAVSRRRWSRRDGNVHVENITVTIGIAHAGVAAALEGLLEHADRAFYEAKAAGRNCVRCADHA